MLDSGRDLKFLFHVKHPPDDRATLRAASRALGVFLSPDQADRLVAYERLLLTRGIPLGLVAASDAPRLRERHVLDCLRVAAIVGSATSAYDLGSGAGLPGLVVAVAVPHLRVGLVESRHRRVAFLELATRELGVSNAEVLVGRVESLTEPVDLCFARAFAPVAEAWAAARRLLRPDGRLVYFSGTEQARRRLPADARLVEVRETSVLESAGPLVIMARQ